MLHNWVKETTTTTGTGTITLAGAVSGFLAFTDVLADGEQVDYMIDDANGNREYGIGTFTASGTTLARTTPVQTVVSGTLDDTSPTAITLSSGTHNVYIAAPAQRIMNGPVIETAPTETTSWHTLDNIFYANNANIAIGTANRMFIEKGPLFLPHKITTLGYQVDVADATCTHFRLGIYKIDRDGEPGDVLYDSGDLSSAVGTTGKKTHTVSGGPIIVPAGVYGLAMVSDSTTLAFRGINNTSLVGPSWGINDVNSYRRYCHSVSSVTGALPNDPTTAFGANERPIFWWR